MKSALFYRCISLLLAAALTAVAATLSHAATAGLTASVPAGIAPDNATPAAVLCTIKGGYPNNIYAIKGTFSPGDRPYYGLTWAPHRQMWASQEERWDSSQAKVSTDQSGNWEGHIFVRLEEAAPRGAMLFRISVVPLSPISDPGPTVSQWYGTTSLTIAPDGNGASFTGHVYTDPECTQPAAGVIVRVMNLTGEIAGAYISQPSFALDGYNWPDSGFFRCAIPSGHLDGITGRTRDNKPILLYYKTQGQWTVPPGEVASVDGIPWGDVNGDALCNAHDVVLALQIASGIYAGPLAYRTRADVWPSPTDGAATLEDAIMIARRLYVR